MNRFGVETFPSLVEAAAAQRMDNWREWDAARVVQVVRCSTSRRTRHRPVSQGETEKIRKLLIQGTPIEDIARQVRRAAQSVRNVLAVLTPDEAQTRAAAITAARSRAAINKTPAAVAEAIRADRRLGKTINELARLHRINRTTVVRALRGEV